MFEKLINKRIFTIVSTLTISEMKGRYRNTWAGFAWVILNPIIMFGVHALVFKHIMQIQLDRYYVFLLGGLLPWIFVSSSLTMTSHTLITSREVLLSFQVSPLAILASKIVDNFVNFLAPFIMVFCILLFQENFSLIGLTTVPLSMILMLIFTYCFSSLTAIAQVYFRDVQYILNFAMSILYFLTPIFYPKEMVPKALVWIVDINPFYAIIRPLQIALYDYNFETLIFALNKSLIVTIITVIIFTLFWRRKRNELYLYL
jgi:ABC-type polysaccharide/polyol phosphate export permease